MRKRESTAQPAHGPGSFCSELDQLPSFDQIMKNQNENPDQPAIFISDGEFYYAVRKVSKILKRRNAIQTQKRLKEITEDAEMAGRGKDRNQSE